MAQILHFSVRLSPSARTPFKSSSRPTTWQWRRFTIAASPKSSGKSPSVLLKLRVDPASLCADALSAFDSDKLGR